MGYVQPGSNPFAQMANGQNYQQPQIALQPTGFVVPQQTAVPQQPNPFGNFLGKQPQQQSTGTHQPFSSYLMSQPTGFQQLQPPQTSGFPQSPQQTFLQPQPTGSNPFRQSMFVPQSTGMALFGASQGQFTPNGHQSSQGASASPPGVSAFSSPSSTVPLPAPTPSMGPSSNNTPARPSSTPLTSYKSSSQPLQPVKSHQTGTKNPFGPITNTPPPVPKAPTLLELTTGMVANGNTSQSQQSAEQPLPQQQTGAFNKFSFNNSALDPGAVDISSVASSFTFNPNAVGSTISEKSSSNSSGFMGSQQTGTTATGSAFSNPSLSQSTTSPTLPGPPTVTSHVTGFGGLKPFIPSSSFGASLMESLPFSGFSPTNPTTSSNTANGLATSPGGANNLSSSSSNGTGSYSFLNSQPTGATGGFGGASSTYKSSLGVGLRPQMTGGGAANPFRASSVGGPNFGAPPSFQPLGTNIFGMNGGAFGTQGQQPQPYGTTSWFGHALYYLAYFLLFVIASLYPGSLVIISGTFQFSIYFSFLLLVSCFVHRFLTFIISGFVFTIPMSWVNVTPFTTNSHLHFAQHTSVTLLTPCIWMTSWVEKNKYILGDSGQSMQINHRRRSVGCHTREFGRTS